MSVFNISENQSGIDGLLFYSTFSFKDNVMSCNIIFIIVIITISLLLLHKLQETLPKR